MDADLLAQCALDAVRDYERERETERRRLSTEFWGHPGAHVHEAFPTDVGRRQAIAARLRENGLAD